MSDEKWKGETVSTKKPTEEEIETAVVAFLENHGKVTPPALVHPIGHRNMMMIQGCSKEKANQIVMKLAKEQGFSEEHLKSLKENLDREIVEITEERMEK